MEFLSNIHSYLIDFDRVPFAAAAILLTMLMGAVTGPIAGNAYPFIWGVVDKVLGPLGDRLNKTQRSHKALLSRGFFLVIIALFVSLILGSAFKSLSDNFVEYGAVEIIILSLMITSGTIWFALLRLYFALEKKDVSEGAYYAIARSIRLNLSMADDFTITRAGIGFAARSFDKGLVAPVFWYLVGGLPVALIYSVLAACAWRFGKQGFTKSFGKPILALEQLMGFIPSLFAGLLMAMASVFTPTAKTTKAIGAFYKGKGRADYAQGGLPLSVIAWALNVSLGGAFQDISGSAIKGEWVGPEGATAQNDHKHLRRAIYINVMAHLLFLLALGSAYIYSGV